MDDYPQKGDDTLLSCGCLNLYMLSSIACQLVECMDEAELDLLIIDLKTLAEMMENAWKRKEICNSL
jgi:hypothetical protein